MDKEKKLHEDLNRMLRRLKMLEQECEEKRKKHEAKDCSYLEGVYSGEKSSFYCAAGMLETLMFCNDVKREGAEDGKARL